MLSQQKINEDKFFFPICQEKRCGGILRIQYSDNNNYNINYQCEKNSNHHGEIYFKTFERFYLRTKLFEKCSKCSINLGNYSEYRCIECHKFYCVNCYKTDIHIKNDFNNLNTSFKICPIHYNKLINYCIDCGEEICIFCLKKNEENNPHSEHSIRYILNMMPSLKEINSLKQKIKEKSKAYRDLIISIDNWLKILNKKIDLLKENLINEISVLEKLFNNYSQDYINYTHFQNFIYFYENINIYNKDNLKNFSKSIKFEEQTKNLLEVLCNQNLENKKKTGTLNTIPEFSPDFISPITDYVVFIHSNNEVCLLSYKNNKLNILKNSKLFFDLKITSVSHSNKMNKIYACLSYEKKIKIFDYNIKEESLTLNNDQIIGDEYFYKCVPLCNNDIVTSYEKSICIWSKNNSNSKKYIIKYKINSNSLIFDLLLVKDRYIIFSRKDNLKFLNNSNFVFIKKISNIEPINSNNGLLSIKDYIIINCCGGIAIVSINTKELIQYINYNISNKVLCRINDDNICMLIINYNYNVTAVKMKFFEGEFIETDEIIALDQNFQPNIHTKDVRLCFINQRKIIIMGKNLYSLQESNC